MQSLSNYIREIYGRLSHGINIQYPIRNPMKKSLAPLSFNAYNTLGTGVSKSRVRSQNKHLNIGLI